MSTATVTPRANADCVFPARSGHSGVRPAGVRTRKGLTVIDGEAPTRRSSVATVSSLDDAPSRRHRRQPLVVDDSCPRTLSAERAGHEQDAVSVAELLEWAYQAVRAQAARLRLWHLVMAVAYCGALVGVIYLGLAIQGEGYAGRTMEYSVASGESVWSVAQDLNLDRPLEDVVIDIQQLNNITQPLQRGQRILLPVE